MGSRELAKQILSASENMDYLDYTEAYEVEIDALTKEIDKAKEHGLVYILSALQQLSN
jgi:hypothetical protein